MVVALITPFLAEEAVEISQYAEATTAGEAAETVEAIVVDEATGETIIVVDIEAVVVEELMQDWKKLSHWTVN